jgi:hypothetical protein
MAKERRSRSAGLVQCDKQKRPRTCKKVAGDVSVMGIDLTKYRGDGAGPARSKIAQGLRKVWDSGAPRQGPQQESPTPGPLQNRGLERIIQDEARKGKRQARPQKALIDSVTNFHMPNNKQWVHDTLGEHGYRYHGQDKSGSHVYKAGNFHKITMGPRGWRHVSYGLTGRKEDATGRDFSVLAKRLSTNR